MVSIFNLNDILMFGTASALVAYLLGSISFSIVVTKLMFNKDIRNYGSGNAGMTNVLRTFGKKAAAITFAGDVLKGIAAVSIGKVLFASFSQSDMMYGAYIAAFFAVLGHIYPVYFGFKGGKAVSVSSGAIAAINPLLIVPIIIVFAIAFLSTKMVSVGSIACAVFYPVCTLLYYVYMVGSVPVFPMVGSTTIALIVIYLHRKNIKRIIEGTEYKFLQNKKNK